MNHVSIQIVDDRGNLVRPRDPWQNDSEPWPQWKTYVCGGIAAALIGASFVMAVIRLIIICFGR